MVPLISSKSSTFPRRAAAQISCLLSYIPQTFAKLVIPELRTNAWERPVQRLEPIDVLLATDRALASIIEFKQL
jgi:hypothetical protein